LQRAEIINTSTDKRERFHFLDGLRGIASFMIVIHHAFTANILRGLEYLHLRAVGIMFAQFTQSGVELFFVLSGIVLLRPYLRGQRKLKVGDYFFRRLKRIYPPYFVALLFGMLVIWVVKSYPTWYSELFKWADLSVAQLLKQAMIISFDDYYYNLAWWSLGIEILFYLLVPVIIFVFPARNKVNNAVMWILLSGTLVVSTGLQLWLTKYYPGLYDYRHIVVNIFQSVCYPVCFLLGMLLAAKDFRVKDARLFMIVGILLVCSSLYYMPVINAGYGFIYAGVIILLFNEHWLRRVLSKPVMIWLGERSYSLFLVHFSVFYLSDYILSHFTSGRNVYYGVFSRLLGVPLALFLAMLLFTFVEKRQAHGLVTGDAFWPWQIRKFQGENFQGKILK
jgi:peptidoglycan/LPS O-acetylase OafA/YrhL